MTFEFVNTSCHYFNRRKYHDADYYLVRAGYFPSQATHRIEATL